MKKKLPAFVFSCIRVTITEKLLFTFLSLFSFVALNSFAQTGTGREYTGTVTNEKGEPLPGVSVIITGTAAGTATDSKGFYRLVSAKNTVTLQFSSVGYEAQTISAGTKPVNNVVLKDLVSGGNTVVVVGYTTQRKRDITGAVSNISTKDILDIPVGGVDQILQGKAAGVAVTQSTGAPGDGISVKIRGIGTINNNDPLYVIDGVPTKDGINQISPNDIESISILKDASSASIYGARAGNGVVVITTKKGRSGKPRFSFSAYTGQQSPAHYIKMANTAEFVNAFNKAATADNLVSSTQRTLIPTNLISTLPNVNWQKEVLKTAPLSNVQMSISGGSENTQYIISANYFTQKGMIQNSSNDRFNLRNSITSTLSDIFKVGTNMNLAYNKTRQVGSSGDGYGSGNPGPSVVRYALFRTPATPVFDTAGNYVDLPNPTTFFGDGLNPVALAANTDRNFYNYTLLGDAYLEISPVKNLKIKSDIGTNFIMTDYRQFFPTWGSPQRLQNSPNSLAQSHVNNLSYNWTNTATYNIITGEHSVSILAGTEAIKNDIRQLSASRTNYVDQTIPFQFLDNGIGIQNNGGNESHWALFSLFSRIAYQYQDKYLATFNFRRDGSSRLSPNNRYGNFFSGSVGWRIDKEAFMKDIKPISNLKLRASLGQLGNQEISNYSYASLIAGGFYYPFGGQSNQGYSIISKGNPNVLWETGTQADVGLDIGLFKNALEITADYYNKTTTNLLLPLPAPTSGGSAGNPYVNAGKVENRGFEFEVAYHANINKNWRFNVNANFATIHNEVLALADATPIVGGRIDNNVYSTITTVGQPIGEFYLLKQEGIFQTPLEVFTHAYQGPGIQPGDVKFQDTNNDGKIDGNDRVYAGSPIPKFTYGFTAGLNFKSFDLNAFFQGVNGNKLYNQVLTDIEGFYRPFNITERVAVDSWNGAGTSNTLPRLSWIGAQNNKQPSTRFLESGSYLRLKNLQLGYTLGANTLSRMKISSFRIFISAQNVFTITKYTGLDPEMYTSANGQGDGVRAVGIDWGTYPSARTITVGANINF